MGYFDCYKLYRRPIQNTVQKQISCWNEFDSSPMRRWWCSMLKSLIKTILGFLSTSTITRNSGKCLIGRPDIDKESPSWSSTSDKTWHLENVITSSCRRLFLRQAQWNVEHYFSSEYISVAVLAVARRNCTLYRFPNLTGSLLATVLHPFHRFSSWAVKSSFASLPWWSHLHFWISVHICQLFFIWRELKT